MPGKERATSLQVSALFPVFAVLDRQTEGACEGAIDLKLAPLMLSVTESRAGVLKDLCAGACSCSVSA